VNDLYVMAASLIAAMLINSIEDVFQSRHLEDVGFFYTVEHHSEGTLCNVIRQRCSIND
jgi:hypothetical protein